MSVTVPVIEGMGPVVGLLALMGLVIVIKWAIGIFF